MHRSDETMFGPPLGTSVLLLAILSAPLTALAADDTSTEQARKRWREGVAAFDAQDYELARAAFAQVYALKPSPPVLRNLGEAEVAAGHYVDGANHLAQFLREAEGLDAEERAMVERSFEKAAQVVGRIELTTNVDGAKVFVDGKQVAITPVDHPLFVEPNLREVRISKGAREIQRLIETTAGQAYPLTLLLDEPPASAPPPTTDDVSPTTLELDSSSDWKLPVVLSGGVLALAGIGAGGYFLARANRLAGDADAQRDRLGGSSLARCTEAPDADCAELDRTVDAGRRAEQLAVGGFVAGGALAVGTALAWWLWPNQERSDRPRTGVRVTPWSNPASATWGGTLSGTF